MTDGGTIWVELPPDCCDEDLRGQAAAGISHLLPVLREYGRFAYLEGNLQGLNGWSQLHLSPYWCCQAFLTCCGDAFHTLIGRGQHCFQQNPLKDQAV